MFLQLLIKVKKIVIKGLNLVCPHFACDSGHGNKIRSLSVFEHNNATDTSNFIATERLYKYSLGKLFNDLVWRS